METKTFTSDPDKEIVASRTVNASQELAFRAWTEPEHLKNWWGPAGFTNTFHEFDLRVGGKWTFTMHGPEKGNYENACEFTIIDKPVHLRWKRYSKPLFQVDVTFEKVDDNRTHIVFRQIFDSVEECSKIKKYTEGKNDENFDKLENELIKMVEHNFKEIKTKS